MNSLSRRRPLVMVSDDDDCSLDDVHRTLREAHRSYGLTDSGNFGRSHCMISINLTSKLAEDDEPLDNRNYSRKRSFSTDDEATAASSAAPSVAPSVVRHSASANRTLAKLEAFLRRGDSHSDLLSFTGSLQSELNRLRSSERELDGLWTDEQHEGDDDCSLDSWKMVGAGVSFVRGENDEDDVSDVSSIQLHSVSEPASTAAPLLHAANVVGAGISFTKDDNNNEDDVSDVSSIHHSPLDAMNIANKHGDHSATTIQPSTSRSKSNPPDLKRVSLTSSLLQQELNEEHDVCPDSPIGTDISFDCSFSTCCSVEEENSPLHDHCQSSAALKIPTLESYQRSTEHEKDIFYATVADEEQILRSPETPERTVLNIPDLFQAAPCTAKSTAAFRSRTNVRHESSLMTLLRCADALAKILYGW